MAETERRRVPRATLCPVIRHARADLSNTRKKMLDVTPQERLALVVLALLLAGGAVTRHLSARADARSWLAYSAEGADTLSPATNAALRTRAEEELTRQRIRDTPLHPGERIDPNGASAEQLARLPRIGQALAERIVAHRVANGSFRTIEDLRAVAGIGPALLEGIAPHIDLPRGPGIGTARAQSGNQIDINRASAEELQSLPGVGPAIAERIVADRLENGPFRQYEDLERVTGIGPKLRERIQPAVRLGG